ncbi:MAG: translation elongation factor-like protein [Chloroflexi bacterium]|nr:translation elongation factor-like protein [Chloroflexota bacterium]
MPEEEVGYVSDFFAHVTVAGIDLTGRLKVGDRIHIRGHTTDIEMEVESMQIQRADATQAGAGDSIGIKVPDRVRKGDKVYKVVE